MTLKVDDWKLLERHPLSALYSNLKGKSKTRLKESIQELGFLPDRPVIIYEGKVLEGWQRQSTCVELDVEPVYRLLPDGQDPERFVESANDIRRHESPELIEKHIKERKARAIERVKAGESQRAAAAAEDISPSAVNRAVAEAVAAGVDMTPESGKATGQDGKARAAPAKKYCPRCIRTGSPVRDCKGCAKVRKAAKKPKAARKKAGPKNGQLVYDDRPFRDGYGLALRQVDVVGKLTDTKESEEANKLRDMFREVRLAFVAYVANSRIAKANADQAKAAAKAAQEAAKEALKGVDAK